MQALSCELVSTSLCTFFSCMHILVCTSMYMQATPVRACPRKHPHASTFMQLAPCTRHTSMCASALVQASSCKHPRADTSAQASTRKHLHLHARTMRKQIRANMSKQASPCQHLPANHQCKISCKRPRANILVPTPPHKHPHAKDSISMQGTVRKQIRANMSKQRSPCKHFPANVQSNISVQQPKSPHYFPNHGSAVPSHFYLGTQ